MEKKQTKVKVVVRVRPTLKKDSKLCVKVIENSVEIFNHRNINENLQYDFCRVYDSTSSQQSVYSESVQPLLRRSLHGQNVSIFAYGPTGAGKTYTMLGSASDPGITPRVINGLFQAIDDQTNEMSSDPFNVHVTFSYLEIYNEKVHDLLEPGNSDLPIREDGNHNIFVSGLAEKPIQNFDEFKNLFGPASNNRTVAATKLNDHSSRSHSILLLKVRRSQVNAPYKEYHGKIYLIDLAGSEDNRRTGNRGIRLKESGAINKSLFSLGEVVDAINAGLARIPYRNSKLTRLLQDSIGGSCHSVMITTLAPEEHYYYDSYCTLNFATKSRKIVNTGAVHVRQPLVALKSSTVQSKLKRCHSEPLQSQNIKKAKVTTPSPSVSLDLPDPTPPNILLSPLLRRQDNLEEVVNDRLQEMEKNIMRHVEQVATSGGSVSMETIQSQLAVLQKQLKQLGRTATGRTDPTPADPDTRLSTQAEQKQSATEQNTGGTEQRRRSSRKPMRDTTNHPCPVHRNPSKKKITQKPEEDFLSPLLFVPQRLFKKGFHSTGARKNIFEQEQEADKQSDILRNTSQLLKSDAQKKHNADFLQLLNTSSVKELQQLHTIGNKRARLIFEWRQLHGIFIKIEDLSSIPSFTNKYLQNLLNSNMVSLGI